LIPSKPKEGEMGNSSTRSGPAGGESEEGYL